MASGYEWHAKTQGNGDWEEIVAPIDCSYYVISDADGPAWQKCSDINEQTSWRSFAAGASFAIIAPPAGHSFGVRWKTGEHITYVKSSAPLDLYFLK